MKKLLSTIALCSAFFTARAEHPLFSYNIQADAVSCNVWRGSYSGGLSFQPDLSLGWESEHTSFAFGTWNNVGASDWCFRSGLPATEDYNPNTKIVLETDVYATLNLWGAIMGFTHYYFYDGKSYFNFGDINSIDGSAQTEVTLGYDFSTLLPNVDLQLTWNMMVSGYDITIDGKRAFSTYIEACYSQHFKYDISLEGVVGFSPWRSIYTDVESPYPTQDFAFNNLTLRLSKSWAFCNDSCCLDVYLQGTMNTCNLCSENAIIKGAGDDKLGKQKLMGVLGVSFSFGGTK